MKHTRRFFFNFFNFFWGVRLKALSEIWAHYLGGPCNLSSFPVLLVYQQHQSDLLQFWSALPLSVSAHIRQRATSLSLALMSEMEYAWTLFIRRESEGEEKENRSGGMSSHARRRPLKKRSRAGGSAGLLSRLGCRDSCQTARMFYIERNLCIFISPK